MTGWKGAQKGSRLRAFLLHCARQMQIYFTIAPRPPCASLTAGQQAGGPALPGALIRSTPSSPHLLNDVGCQLEVGIDVAVRGAGGRLKRHVPVPLGSKVGGGAGSAIHPGIRVAAYQVHSLGGGAAEMAA